MTQPSSAIGATARSQRHRADMPARRGRPQPGGQAPQPPRSIAFLPERRWPSAGTTADRRPDSRLPPSPRLRRAGPPPVTIDNPPALRATGAAASSTTAVSLPSTTRWMRSQVAGGTRDRLAAGTSARSSTTSVQTPDWTMRLSDLRARSIVRSSSVPGPETARRPGTQAGSTAAAVFDSACPRTHSNCGNSMPQAAAVIGSNRSKVSISATHSPRRLAAASAAQARLVRPDDTGPTTSDTCPRGTPPRTAASRAACSKGASPGVAAGVTEVRVRSRFRVRSRACTASRADGEDVMCFRLLFDIAPHISETKPKVKPM